MAFSISFSLANIFVHLLAFFCAFRGEENRIWALEIPNVDETICVYDTDDSTIYGFGAFFCLLINQVFLNLITRCFCCGKGLISGRANTCAIISYILSW
ncbi:hypothetical protein MtrunA17_Chr1g0209291 [Medicago truncatula]|uniref:Fiber protein Fb34 n=1 Tax=Medicago truncatula TaxID=3880 RepID=A0A072VQX0_MEDTR|nr:fiber protein Fb34 [Medicago truncatula]RHN82377.1 hypothetical protein MtrunA17_Chr1g0209291 [Medicago truncatula]